MLTVPTTRVPSTTTRLGTTLWHTTLRHLAGRLAHALDAYTENRMRQAIPPSVLRRAEESTLRLRRPLRGGRSGRRTRGH